MRKKVKIELKCTFGKNVAGDVIEIDAEKAEIMIAEGNAKVNKDREVGDSKEVTILKADLAKAKEEFADASEKLNASEEANVALVQEIETLKADLAKATKAPAKK